jgi:hypothetical protein
VRPPPSLRKPQVFDATPNRAFLRGFPFSQFSDFWSLPAFARFDDGFWRFVSASKNSVPGGRDRARGWTAVPIENQSRTYWWCSPPKIWRQKIIRRYARTAHPSPRREMCVGAIIIFSCTTAAGGGGGIRRTRQRGRGIPVGSNRSVVRHTLPWRPWRRRLIANAH